MQFQPLQQNTQIKQIAFVQNHNIIWFLSDFHAKKEGKRRFFRGLP
jgi:hypothetical protein